MTDSPYIVTVAHANFAQEVLERSKQVPVLVDFWAAWCAPCQMLMPVLGRLAQEYQGKFVLAKVNSDEEQKLAMQFGVRSLPTLKLFRHGKPVRDMVGAQPESVIRALLEEYIERPADRLRARARAAHEAGDSAEAVAVLQAALGEDPEYYRIHEDLAEVLIDLGRLDEAETLVHGLPANVQAEARVEVLVRRLDLAKTVAGAPDEAALAAAVDADPKNLLARYQLATHKVLRGDYESALEHYLEIMRRDRGFQEDAGRKGLLAVFALLDNQGALVSRYRSKMSTLLY